MLDACRDCLPLIRLRSVAEASARARKQAASQIIWGMGGHVIKCGLAPVLLDLMRRGYATAFAMNGSAAIHDFEIAIAGRTSEDVEAVLPDGRFGSAEETGREMNAAIAKAIALGSEWAKRSGCIFRDWRQQTARSRESVFRRVARGHSGYGARGDRHRYAAYASGGGRRGDRLGIASRFPVVRAYGEGLHEGGVYVNVGSAVVMPEVFLKAVSVARNLGYPLAEFHDREFRFPAALPAEGECGGTAARAMPAARDIRSPATTRL